MWIYILIITVLIVNVLNNGYYFTLFLILILFLRTFYSIFILFIIYSILF